jgi:hypothetical protein
MPYTNKSLAMVWLITVALFALTGSGAVAGWWVLLIVLVALAAPALMLRSPSPKGMTAGNVGSSGSLSSLMFAFNAHAFLHSAVRVFSAGNDAEETK